MTWVVKEYERYSNKFIMSWSFPTEEAALEHYNSSSERANNVSNQFAGVGGRWRHYFSYPQEIQEASKLINPYASIGVGKTLRKRRAIVSCTSGSDF